MSCETWIVHNAKNISSMCVFSHWLCAKCKETSEVFGNMKACNKCLKINIPVLLVHVCASRITCAQNGDGGC